MQLARAVRNPERENPDGVHVAAPRLPGFDFCEKRWCKTGFDSDCRYRVKSLHVFDCFEISSSPQIFHPRTAAFRLIVTDSRLTVTKVKIFFKQQNPAFDFSKAGFDETLISSVGLHLFCRKLCADFGGH